jgi:fatty-acyl-CoA synthase
MSGYWGEEEKTREAIDAAGWMHTGDLATIDAEGYGNIVGRIKDMVIRGGENLYPREIEDYLYKHPKIQDVQVFGVADDRYGEELCAWIRVRAGETLTPEEVLFEHPAIGSAQVIGVPDERMGEELMAWIVVHDGATVSDDEVRTFCRERLAHFKVPRYVKVVDEFPMTVTGKIQKFRMRELAIAELGLEEAAAMQTA